MRLFYLETERGFFCRGVTPGYVDAIMSTLVAKVSVACYKWRELRAAAQARMQEIAAGLFYSSISSKPE